MQVSGQVRRPGIDIPVQRIDPKGSSAERRHRRPEVDETGDDEPIIHGAASWASSPPHRELEPPLGRVCVDRHDAPADRVSTGGQRPQPDTQFGRGARWNLRVPEIDPLT